MDVVRILGGNPLHGEITVSGSKNAALPIFAATLLTDEECIIENVPDLSDVRFMAEILSELGADISESGGGTWSLKARNIGARTPYELVRKMRASVCIMGPLVARLGHAEVSLPGGCIIGPRPIDLHLNGLKRLGCAIEMVGGYVIIDGERAQGTNLFLGGRYGPTVTGSANLIMAATLIPGITRIESAACEPEVVDLCNFLIAMGARIEGIGSHHLVIEGVESLHGCRYRIINDRIEAGTFIIGGAITRGNLRVKGVPAHHLGALINKLEEADVNLSVEAEDTILVSGANPRRPVDLITHPHPGFPTDLQAQMCALMCVTPGLSIITEKIYPNRFMHVSELMRMGASISIEGPSAIISGSRRLSGAPLMASDLRASAALIIAGLAAEGETWVQRIYHLDRGYQHIDARLRAIGADVERLPAAEMPSHLLAEV